MARGGKRKGTPGVTYGQRRDLNQPVNFDGGYGEDQPQAALQQNRPRPAPVQAPAAPAPGSLTPLNAPTARPNEPLQAGLPTGPDAGPEILGLSTGSSSLVKYLPILELRASQPGSSAALRQIVRKIRGSV